MTPKLVLLVDVDADIRRRYRAALEGMGYDVVEAEDGRQALAIACSRPPSFVVTDTRLAFIDGYELCALLRRDPETRAARIVVFIDDPHPLKIERARAAGADAQLVKPCMPDVLVAEMQRLDLPRGETRQSTEPSTPASRRDRSAKRAYARFDTTHPPVVPPSLQCPTCDAPLRYVHSHIGGVSARHAEQWDYFACASCGTFQYRQRTRTLRPAL